MTSFACYILAVCCTSALTYGFSFSPDGALSSNHVIQGIADDKLQHIVSTSEIVNLLTRQTTHNVKKRSIDTGSGAAVVTTNIYNGEKQMCNQSNAFESNIQTPVCPTAVSTGQSDPLNKRSTCPWAYVVDHDPDRFPATIFKAISSCTTCIGSDVDECNAITQPMTVIMRRRLPGGADEYTSEKVQLDVPVAFTCAGRRLAPASNTREPDVHVPYV